MTLPGTDVSLTDHLFTASSLLPFISIALILNWLCFSLLQLQTLSLSYASWHYSHYTAKFSSIPICCLKYSCSPHLAILGQIYCFSSRDSPFTVLPLKLLTSLFAKEFKSPRGLVLLRNMSKTFLQWNHWSMQSTMNIPLPCWTLDERQVM